jgi:ribosomal-protein-alanine N-acetyltransferase
VCSSDLTVDIRQGSIADIDEAMITMERAFDPQYGEAWTASQCMAMFSMPGTWIMLARIDDTPAGFALNRQVLDEVELLLLAVAEPFRRKGVARKLIEATFQVAQQQGATQIHLEMRHNNPAYNLYVNCGFTLIGRRKAYYHGANGEFYDALTLCHSLSGEGTKFA